MGWENAVCKVERDNSGDKGTGWLCSEEGYVITAGHLFIGEKEASPFRPDNNKPITATLTFSSQSLKANLVIAWRDDENTGIDAAILRCEERPGIEPLKVISEEPENQKVTIYGCGDESDFRFEAAYGILNGYYVQKPGNKSFRLVSIDCKASGQNGFSGAPVYSEQYNAVIAVQSEIYPDKNSADRDTIYAVSIHDILDCCKQDYPEITGIFIHAIPNLFWNAGKTWYEEMRKPGARFHRLNIVDHILPSGTDKKSEYTFPFHTETSDEKSINFLEILQSKDSVYRNGHFVLTGEGGIGKTTLLMSVMQDAYEGKDHYRNETMIPLFVELSLAPDTDSHAYDGISSTVIRRIIYAILKQSGSGKYRADLLRECMNDPASVAKDTLRKYFKDAEEPDVRFILLVDGFNEVPIEVCRKDGRRFSPQARIISEISEIAGEFDNVTIVLTGRSEIAVNNTSFHMFKLRGLEWDQIEEYLRQEGKTEEEITHIQNDKGLLKLLKVPLFLTMYTRLKDTEGISRRGELMKIFFHERTERRREDFERQSDIIKRKDDKESSIPAGMARGEFTPSVQWMFLDILIPEIAAKMEAEKSFRISEREVRTLLKTLFNNTNSDDPDSLYFGRYQDYTDDCFDIRLGEESLSGVIAQFWNNENPRHSCKEFLAFCESSMGILYKESERSYGFIHQHFRDYFAAVNIVNRMKVADTASEDSFSVAREILQPYEKSPINPLLMDYVGEYLGEHHNNPSEKDVRAASAGTEEALKDRALISELVNIYRNSDQSSSYAVYNLFTILKRVRKDLSGFDFHDLDLRRCQFYGVTLDTCAGTNFSGAFINAGNWFAEGHTGAVNSASFSRDGKHIVTASDDHTARIWDAETGSLLHKLEGHTDWVRTALFSPDGRKIVTASDDETARIWDAETGRLSITLYEEDGLYIEGVDFCDIDSKSILTDIQKEIFRQYGAIV